MTNVIVIKQNIHRQETWRYQAKIIRKAENYIQLEARFNRNDTIIAGVLFRNNDRFLEVFFSDRWFNIFEIHDKDDDQIKGWYCDICMPAQISEHEVKYVDLKLDLLVHPDGKFEIMDEDEFDALELDAQTKKQALIAMNYLQENFFDLLSSLSMGLK